MSAAREGQEMDRLRQQADLSYGDLWLRYFALGGTALPEELEWFLGDPTQSATASWAPTPHEYDTLAHALNERFGEQGSDMIAPYQFVA